MSQIQEYSFLIIFPDGMILKGFKLPSIGNHHEILEKMREIYPTFEQMASSYDLKNHKQQVKLYNELVNNGAIIYHSWSTFIEENTDDANFYLPNMITSEQKKFMDSIMEQLNMISNVIPHEICDRGYLEMSNYEFYKGAQYIQEYMESHLIKNK